MSMELLQPAQVQALVEAGIPDAKVAVEDLTGTRDHYKVIVVSDSFEGKSRIQRHMMINEALKEPLKGPIHALTIEAYTQTQWAQQPAAPAPMGIKF
jgi:stress-induced morphogen